MSTTQQQPALDYGEPWNKTYFDHEKSNNKIRCYHLLPGDLKRAIACVNACAGMADPAAEIQAMREALQCADWLLEADGYDVEDMTRAKLQPFLPKETRETKPR